MTDVAAWEALLLGFSPAFTSPSLPIFRQLATARVVRVEPPWGGEPLGLPINMRLHRKGGPGLLELTKELMREVAAWFPDRQFHLCADGFFAPLAGASLPRCHLTSR